MSEQLKRLLHKADKALIKHNYKNAGALYQQAAEEFPASAAAWFGLGEVSSAIGMNDAAVDFFAQAASLRPEHARAHQRLGEAFSKMGEVERATAALDQALRLAPNDAQIRCALAGIQARAGDWRGAKESLLPVTRSTKAVAAHHHLLGLACQQLGELDEAEAAFRNAVRLDARYTEAWISLGTLRMERGRVDEAESCLRKLDAIAPGSADVARFAGDLAMRQGDTRDAVQRYRQGLQAAPDDPYLQGRMALSLAESGDLSATLDAMEALIAQGMSPDWVFEQLGKMMVRQKEWFMAKDSLELAVQRDPENLTAWNILLVAYTKLGEADKAQQAAETILAKDPNSTQAMSNLASLYSMQGRADEAITLLRQAMRLQPTGLTLYINLLWNMVHSSEITAAEVLAVARDFDQNICLPLLRPDSFARRDRDPNRRLRIGWLSSDMNKHAVALFTLPFLHLLDRGRLESIVYNNSIKTDETADVAKSLADIWRDVFDIGDEALANLIRADEIDILVDLNGNTEGNRLLAVARKPAPIQVTWLGFPGTSGMTAMDYILIPPDPVLQKGEWCAETPWPLPDCYGVRADITTGIPVAPGLPCELLDRPFTYACLNNFRKASDQAVALWSRILLQAPESKLMLVARSGQEDNMRRRIEARFAAHGVGPERLEILGHMSTEQYIRRYNLVDLCLDPFPFNGGTTSYDSIWMGVPFVTWPGDMLVSRMGRAILRNVGLAELVADSADAYVALAVEMWRDRERLKRLRLGLRERMQTSPLMDAAKMARSLQDAFRGMWLKWLEKSGAA
ncbi:MAG: tetratricopeptide repeat protein [Desulfobulbaceae bacterium]|jgi:predicted O-linked N-acetylglucosamine transferase (SPINDLY family)|nr:tetratricopeptide repeat protein [Desulfobulbaceae bacterium]